MQIYIATLFAKHGAEDDVMRFYQDMEEQLRAAKGFRNRRIFRAQPGRMFEIVKQFVSAEELAAANERPHPEGVHFVMLEEWDSAEDRVRFSRSLDKARSAKLYPNLLPQHTHEFYTDVTEAG
jgi:quinol monooxygenase YgiN